MFPSAAIDANSLGFFVSVQITRSNMTHCVTTSCIHAYVKLCTFNFLGIFSVLVRTGYPMWSGRPMEESVHLHGRLLLLHSEYFHLRQSLSFPISISSSKYRCLRDQMTRPSTQRACSTISTWCWARRRIFCTRETTAGRSSFTTGDRHRSSTFALTAAVSTMDGAKTYAFTLDRWAAPALLTTRLTFDFSLMTYVEVRQLFFFA